MEHYSTDFRDEFFTDTGGVKANKGDKFLYYARLPEEAQTKSRSFSVWMKAIIKNCQGKRVWLEKVQVLEGFRSEAKAKAVEEHKDSLINRFRGNKHLTLSKSEVWFIFPANTKTGVSDYISKNGHEALATALGLPQDVKNEDVEAENEDNKQKPIPCADKLEDPKQGGGRIQKGYKILYETMVPPQYTKENEVLSVWTLANIKDTNGQQVWLDEVEVLNGFINKEHNELVAKHALDIANNIQGDANLKLKRNGSWSVFPQGAEAHVKDYINNYGQESLRIYMGLYEQVLPFQRLLELLKLPPHIVKSNLPAYISHQWKTDPEGLIRIIKAIPPTATMNEIITQLSRDIKSESLHTFLYSSTPAHSVLPTPRLMELLKLPQDANPVQLPSFILIERETSPKELISRLEAMSKEENILIKLMEENSSKENYRPQTETKEKAIMVSQPETTTKDVPERDTSAREQIETPVAPVTQPTADVWEGTTIQANDHGGNKVHKLEEHVKTYTKKVIDEEPETKTIKAPEPKQVTSKGKVIIKPRDADIAEEKMHEAERKPNTTTIVPEETKVSTTKIQGRTKSGSPAQTEKAQQNAPLPREKGVKETHQKSVAISKEQIVEDQKRS